MSRGLSSAMLSAVAKSNVKVAFFAQFDFSAASLYLWSGVGNYSWNGQTWQGVGTLLGFKPISEFLDGRSSGLSFSLSGVPSIIINAAFSQQYRGRNCALYLALFDDSWAVLANPTQVWGGRMDVMTIQDGGDTCAATLTAESRLVQLQVARQVRYTDGEQQRLFPGDKGLEFVSALQLKEIAWGVAPAVTDSPSSGGGGPHSRTVQLQ